MGRHRQGHFLHNDVQPVLPKTVAKSTACLYYVNYPRAFAARNTIDQLAGDAIKRKEVMKKRVVVPVPAHFAGMDHQLEDMQVAVIRAGLPEQDKRRREEMRFIHNFGILAPLLNVT